MQLVVAQVGVLELLEFRAIDGPDPGAIDFQRLDHIQHLGLDATDLAVTALAFSRGLLPGRTLEGTLCSCCGSLRLVGRSVPVQKLERDLHRRLEISVGGVAGGSDAHFRCTGLAQCLEKLFSKRSHCRAFEVFSLGILKKIKSAFHRLPGRTP